MGEENKTPTVFQKAIRRLKTNDGYKIISHLTSAESVEMHDGTRLSAYISNFLRKINPVAEGSFSLNRNKDTLIGSFSTTLGKDNEASGDFSLAEGQESHAKGHGSHAEGRATASGIFSHAEGEGTAKGYISHAEGSGTTESNAQYAHAEGSGTFAETNFSHAEGLNTHTRGKASHSEGYATVAHGDYQHVEGKFNIEDLDNKYVHIVGNGTNDTNRSNAYTLDWDGNGEYAGDVTAKDVFVIDENGDKTSLSHENMDVLDKLGESTRGKLTYNGKEISVNGDIIAKEHDPSIDVMYKVGDLVIKDDKLYKCIEGQNSTWREECWKLTCVADEIEAESIDLSIIARQGERGKTVLDKDEQLVFDGADLYAKRENLNYRIEYIDGEDSKSNVVTISGIRHEAYSSDNEEGIHKIFGGFVYTYYNDERKISPAFVSDKEFKLDVVKTDGTTTTLVSYVREDGLYELYDSLSELEYPNTADISNLDCYIGYYSADYACNKLIESALYGSNYRHATISEELGRLYLKKLDSDYAIVKKGLSMDGSNPNGKLSVALGKNTTVGGDYSVSEGENTKVNGVFSHAEGKDNMVRGNYSHAEGRSNNILQGAVYSHAEGSYNNLQEGVYESHAEGSANTIGCGSSSVHVEGNFNSAGYVNKNTSGQVTNTHMEGSNNTIYAGANGNHAEGINNVVLNGTYASHVEGYGNKMGSYNDSTHVEGKSNFLGTSSETTHIEGQDNIVAYKGVANPVDDDGKIDETKLGKDSDFNHVEGRYNKVWSDSSYNHVEGKGNELNSETNHVEGYYNKIQGDSSNYNHVEGSTNNTTKIKSTHVEGLNNSVTNVETSHVEGQNVVGSDGNSAPSYLHVEGSANNVHVFNNNAHIEGQSNQVTGNGGSIHVEGNGNTVGNLGAGFDSFGAHVEGYSNTMTNLGKASHVEGESNSLEANNAHIEGASNKVGGRSKTSTGAHVEGQGNIASGIGIHVEGMNNASFTQTSHVEGSENVVSDGNAFDAHVEGTQNFTRSSQGHVEGKNNLDLSYNVSHVEGRDNVNLFDGTHVEGVGIVACEQNQHVQGRYNEKYNVRFEEPEEPSYIEGNYIKTYKLEYVEGYVEKFGCDYYKCKPNYGYSHDRDFSKYPINSLNDYLLGRNYNYTDWYKLNNSEIKELLKPLPKEDWVNTKTYSVGDTVRYTDGYGNVSYYVCVNPITSMYKSTPPNSSNTGDVQFWAKIEQYKGRWTYSDSSYKKYAHIVGNGANDASRSNAHTLDWNGNAWYAGDVEGMDKDGYRVGFRSLINTICPPFDPCTKYASASPLHERFVYHNKQIYSLTHPYAEKEGRSEFQLGQTIFEYATTDGGRVEIEYRGSTLTYNDKFICGYIVMTDDEIFKPVFASTELIAYTPFYYNKFDSDGNKTSHPATSIEKIVVDGNEWYITDFSYRESSPVIEEFKFDKDKNEINVGSELIYPVTVTSTRQAELLDDIFSQANTFDEGDWGNHGSLTDLLKGTTDSKHWHENLYLLNKFSMSEDGTLLFDGDEIGGNVDNKTVYDILDAIVKPYRNSNNESYKVGEYVNHNGKIYKKTDSLHKDKYLVSDGEIFFSVGSNGYRTSEAPKGELYCALTKTEEYSLNYYRFIAYGSRKSDLEKFVRVDGNGDYIEHDWDVQEVESPYGEFSPKWYMTTVIKGDNTNVIGIFEKDVDITSGSNRIIDNEDFPQGFIAYVKEYVNDKFNESDWTSVEIYDEISNKEKNDMDAISSIGYIPPDEFDFNIKYMKRISVKSLNWKNRTNADGKTEFYATFIDNDAQLSKYFELDSSEIPFIRMDDKYMRTISQDEFENNGKKNEVVMTAYSEIVDWEYQLVTICIRDSNNISDYLDSDDMKNEAFLAHYSNNHLCFRYSTNVSKNGDLRDNIDKLNSFMSSSPTKNLFKNKFYHNHLNMSESLPTWEVESPLGLDHATFSTYLNEGTYTLSAKCGESSYNENNFCTVEAYYINGLFNKHVDFNLFDRFNTSKYGKGFVFNVTKPGMVYFSIVKNDGSKFTASDYAKLGVNIQIEAGSIVTPYMEQSASEGEVPNNVALLENRSGIDELMDGYYLTDGNGIERRLSLNTSDIKIDASGTYGEEQEVITLEEFIMRKQNDIVNIKDLGAEGDGSTDDTEALKRAVMIGKTVIFPEGTYMLYDQLDMTNDIDWVGIGDNVTIKFMPADRTRPEEYGDKIVYNSYMISQSRDMGGEYSLSLKNITLDANKQAFASDELGNGATKYDHVTCIDLFNPRDVILDHVTIKNALIEGCYIYYQNPQYGAKISNCTFIGNGYYQEDASGLHLEGRHNKTVVDNCIFEANGFHGLLLGGCEHASISNIKCIGNGFEGVCLWGGSSYNTLSNVTCEGNRGGLMLKTSYLALVEDVEVDWDESLSARYNTISNLITRGNTYGIIFGTSNENLISNWVCEDECMYSSSAFKETDVKIANASINYYGEDRFVLNANQDFVRIAMLDDAVMLSETDSEDVDFVNGSSSIVEYSTDELFVGKWIGGKNLYQKTIILDNIETVAQDWKPLTVIEDCSEIVYSEGFIQRTSDGAKIFTNGAYFTFRSNGNSLSYYCKDMSTWSNNRLTVTVRYIK